MFHDLGLYAEQFEQPFIAATSSFYVMEASAQLQSVDVPLYLQHVRSRLSQEEERVVHYLHPSTRKALVQTALQKLLTDHVDRILEKGFTLLMEQQRLEDMSRMYSLFVLVDALPKLRQASVASVSQPPFPLLHPRTLLLHPRTLLIHPRTLLIHPRTLLPKLRQASVSQPPFSLLLTVPRAPVTQRDAGVRGAHQRGRHGDGQRP